MEGYGTLADDLFMIADALFATGLEAWPLVDLWGFEGCLRGAPAQTSVIWNGGGNLNEGDCAHFTSTSPTS